MNQEDLKGLKLLIENRKRQLNTLCDAVDHTKHALRYDTPPERQDEIGAALKLLEDVVDDVNGEIIELERDLHGEVKP